MLKSNVCTETKVSPCQFEPDCIVISIKKTTIPSVLGRLIGRRDSAVKTEYRGKVNSEILTIWYEIPSCVPASFAMQFALDAHYATYVSRERYINSIEGH